MNQFNGQQPQQPINQQQQMSLQIIQQQLANITPDQQQALLRQHPQLAAFLHHYQQQRMQQSQASQQGQQQAQQQPQQQHFQQGQPPMSVANRGSAMLGVNGGIRNMMPGPGMPPQQAAPPAPQKPPRKKRITKKEAKAQAAAAAAAAAAAQAGSLSGQSMPPTPMNHTIPPNPQAQQHLLQQQQQQQPQQIPVQPPIPPVIESILPLNKIDPTTYWSKHLKEEGINEIPSNVLLYEQITKRDIDDSRTVANNGQSAQHAALAKRLGAELKYYENLRTVRSQSIDPKFPNVKSIWGEGYSGYGNGFTEGGKPTQLVYPNYKKRFSRIPDEYISPIANLANAELPEQLIPIRLEFDLEKDKFKLNDTFVWNINERLVTLERFVSVLMEDYKFKNPLHTNTVLQCIKEQLSEYIPIVLNQPSRTSSLQDVRIPIKLDITIANNQLVDQFEWDLTNPENNPEEFAATMVAELSLATEFTSAIAHTIREQCQLYTKALYTAGYQFDGASVEEDEIRRFLSPNIQEGDVKRAKNSLSTYTPSVLEINLNELERLDKDKERESRRKRRTQGRSSTRRGGPTLPDLSDYPKTIRTVVPNSVLPGGVDLSNSTFMFTENVEKVTVPEDQFIKAQAPPAPPVFKKEDRKNKSVFYEDLGDSFNVTIRLR